MRYEIHKVPITDSTNTELKELAKCGAPEGYVLVADAQTAGRGRLGRSFFSPPGSGLYVSILTRPKEPLSPAALTCLAAVALADTVSSYGIDCRIKWVNDLFIDGKKAAGILTEGSFCSDGSFAYAIVGIGVNLYLPDDVPGELRPIITSVFDHPTDLCTRDEFLDRLLLHFGEYYEKLPEITFREKYAALQNCFGRTVAFTENGTQRTGIAEGIDDSFRLLVREGNRVVSLERGEVTFAD